MIHVHLSLTLNFQFSGTFLYWSCLSVARPLTFHFSVYVSSFVWLIYKAFKYCKLLNFFDPPFVRPPFSIYFTNWQCFFNYAWKLFQSNFSLSIALDLKILWSEWVGLFDLVQGIFTLLGECVSTLYTVDVVFIFCWKYLNTIALVPKQPKRGNLCMPKWCRLGHLQPSNGL